MDVLDSIKTLLRVSRAFGIAPYKYKHKTLKRSRCLTCYSFAFTTAVTLLLFLYTANNISYHSTAFLPALISGSHWLTVSTNSLLTVFVLCRYQEVLRVDLVKLNEFQVFKSRLRGRQLKSLKTTANVCSFGAISHCILFGYVYYVTTRKRKFFLPYPEVQGICFFGLYVGIFMSYAWCVQFVIYASVIRQCFIMTNERFVDVLKTPGGPSSHRLGVLVAAHNFLIDVTENAASVFSCYFLAITFLVFVETLYTFTYYLALDFRDAWLGSLIWLSYYVFQFGGVLGSATATSSEAEKTANYLHELFIDNDDPELKEEIEIFSLQLLHRKVEFNACGFFKLDFSLLYSMVGAVTTYIIILMQFQGNNPTHYGNCTAVAVECRNCTMAS